MELATEDGLRLAVLLAGEVQAVRIDEAAMTLHALTPKGEARIPLNPTGRREAYLTTVREQLGGYALGSPGGYPVHLRHWTRMGQATPKNLEALLKLGEDEAFAAVAYAPGLTDELARRVWWALPTVDIARVMLMHPEVRAGTMGRVMAAYLVEHLPFEADTVTAMNIVRTVLAADLLDEAVRLSLWQKARRRPHYLVGFLESADHAMPVDEPPLSVAEHAGVPTLAGPWGVLRATCHSAAGQTWLKAMELALDKASVHETVYVLFDLLGARFASVHDIADDEAIPADEAAAMRALAQIGSRDAEAVLLRTTAVGPQLRKKLEPLIAPLLAHLRTLQGR